jgi:hypothetical protein
LLTRATSVHGIGSCVLIAPPQFGQVRREPDNQVGSIDASQF